LVAQVFTVSSFAQALPPAFEGDRLINLLEPELKVLKTIKLPDVSVMVLSLFFQNGAMLNGLEQVNQSQSFCNVSFVFDAHPMPKRIEPDLATAIEVKDARSFLNGTAGYPLFSTVLQVRQSKRASLSGLVEVACSVPWGEVRSPAVADFRRAFGGTIEIYAR